MFRFPFASKSYNYCEVKCISAGQVDHVANGGGGGCSFDRETAVILEAELKKRKELFNYFDFTVENIPIF